MNRSARALIARVVDADHVLRFAAVTVLGTEEHSDLRACSHQHVFRVDEVRSHRRGMRDEADVAPAHEPLHIAIGCHSIETGSHARHRQRIPEVRRAAEKPLNRRLAGP